MNETLGICNVGGDHISHPQALPRLPDQALDSKQCIWLIRNIPDFLMEYRHGIILSFDPEIQDGLLIKAIREQYRNKAAWLEYYWLDKHEALPELTFTHKVHYKPLAERTRAFYHLAQEIYPRLASAQEQNLRPLEWTLQCEIQLCEIALKNSYYESTIHPPVGKSERYKEATHYYQWLEDAENLEFGGTRTVSAIEKLEMDASFLAKNDLNFRNNHYRRYCQTQKQLFRTIRDSPLLGVVATPDGGIKILGKGQGGRAKNKKRGFKK